MSLLKTIKSVFAGKPEAGERDTSRTYIVDGEKLVDMRDAGPGDRAQMLQKFGRFADREKIRATLVFGGRPLREAGPGDEYMGVTVYYAEQGKSTTDHIRQLVRDGRRDKTVVFTNDAAFEAELTQQGVLTMRCSTLRKAMSEGGGEGGGDRGGDNRGGQRRRGGRGGPRRSDDQRREGQQQNQAPSATDTDGGSEPSQGSGGDSNSQAVKNLIDLVD